ncbi:hypothetical protein CRENBAI_005691 [Crenichthys baileyi]|uniref:Uncharacterized protein n=1 Tax=Crenichthys baileyi TaxID=28760 RepID=A0AAV9S9C5_9TELE
MGGATSMPTPARHLSPGELQSGRVSNPSQGDVFQSQSVEVSPTISSQNLSTSHTNSGFFPTREVTFHIHKSQLLQPRIRLSRSQPSATTHNTLHPTPLAHPTGGEPIGRGTHVSSSDSARLHGSKPGHRGVRQLDPPPGLAPEWGPGDPRLGDGPLCPFVAIIIRGLFNLN